MSISPFLKDCKLKGAFLCRLKYLDTFRLTLWSDFKSHHGITCLLSCSVVYIMSTIKPLTPFHFIIPVHKVSGLVVRDRRKIIFSFHSFLFQGSFVSFYFKVFSLILTFYFLFTFPLFSESLSSFIRHLTDTILLSSLSFPLSHHLVLHISAIDLFLLTFYYHLLLFTYELLFSFHQIIG